MRRKRSRAWLSSWCMDPVSQGIRRGASQRVSAYSLSRSAWCANASWNSSGVKSFSTITRRRRSRLPRIGVNFLFKPINAPGEPCLQGNKLLVETVGEGLQLPVETVGESLQLPVEVIGERLDGGVEVTERCRGIGGDRCRLGHGGTIPPTLCALQSWPAPTDRRSAVLSRRHKLGPLPSGGDASGADGVREQHGDGHGPDPAGHPRDAASDLGDACEVDIAHEAPAALAGGVVDAVRANIDDGRAGLHPCPR